MPRQQPYTVVDTHCHAGLRRYEPIESLVDQMFRNGVGQAVLIQHMGEYDNRYLSECCQRFPGRFAVAALVDPTRPDAPEALARWAIRPGVMGARLECGDPEPLWKKLDDLGMVVSLRGMLEDLAADETRRRMSRYGRAKFCIEHLGMPNVKEDPPYPAYSAVLRLAELPNVWLKVSGCSSLVKGEPIAGVFPFAWLALDAFGPRRMMWGSDFPWVSVREGYHNALASIDLLYPGLSQEEKAWVMGRTAQQVWSLESD